MWKKNFFIIYMDYILQLYNDAPWSFHPSITRVQQHFYVTSVQCNEFETCVIWLNYGNHAIPTLMFGASRYDLTNQLNKITDCTKPVGKIRPTNWTNWPPGWKKSSWNLTILPPIMGENSAFFAAWYHRNLLFVLVKSLRPFRRVRPLISNNFLCNPNDSLEVYTPSYSCATPAIYLIKVKFKIAY